MASGKYSLHFVSAVACLCISSVAFSADPDIEALPCATPVLVMSTQNGSADALDTDLTNVTPLSAATTNPRTGLVSIPELLSREEMALLSESELHDRIASVEQAISSLFEKLPVLRPASPVTRTQSGCL